ISIRDLCKTIIEKLKDIYSNLLPSDVKIPSDEWIHLQFCPMNATTTRAMYYTVFQESILATTNHDFSKLSLTPSVIFFISIPNDISGLFYNRQAFVSYKDTILEPSTAIRHSTEFLNALRIQYAHQEMLPILSQEFGKLESELKEYISGIQELLNS
ncbi:39202_t:CDS:2, partial [Gigaspora margarita]